MPNMSYCRFENTYFDLDDCYTALYYESWDELSETERGTGGYGSTSLKSL
jgi:hypothetical protein